MINGCKNESININLQIVLENINGIQTANYHSTHYHCYSGDTIPIDENHFYFKEYTQPSDTSVGAYYVKFDFNDTTKMLFAYDGNIRARINWEDNNYEIDDFSNNFWGFRTVMAPFFSKAKALIEYVSSTTDSIQIDSTDFGTTLAYRFQIINERVELVGRLPIHINELGSNQGVISEYILWVDKETKLPFKFQRTLPANTMAEVIDNLTLNNLDIDYFNIANYIPKDMPPRSSESMGKKSNLLNTLAPKWELPDLKNELYKLDNFSSKIFMINITSIHCGVCKLYIPFLNELKEKHSEELFDFVSLFDVKQKNNIAHYINENNLKYKVL